MAYGLDMRTTALENMGNHNYGNISPPNVTPKPGAYTTLSAETMRVQLGTFYSHSSIKSANTDVKYSLPYVDSSGMGLMVTASKPVYVDNVLQGVVGFDITMKYLLEPVEHLVSETVYAFVIEATRGYMLYH